MTERRRLPNRRKSETTTLTVGNAIVTATVGFDRDGKPAEIFLSAGRVGTELDALLGDAAVAISVALQSGVPASAMAKSIGRIPTTIDGPARAPASAVGCALRSLDHLRDKGGGRALTGAGRAQRRTDTDFR